MEIFGCEFYQNKGQSYLIHVYSVIPFYLELDNCSIYDNEIDYSTISIQGSNSESMITVTNCLFFNNTSDWHIFLTLRLYMRNVNLISNMIKWIGTSIIEIAPLYTNGEQNLNMSNINFINNTAWNRS